MMKGLLRAFSGLLLTAIIATDCSTVKTAIDKDNSLTVKILSYNVKNCIGMDKVVDYQRVADVINRINPEIVVLQELDSATLRSKGVVVLDELSRRTNMFKSYRASIDFQGGKYGIGVLTKEKPLGIRSVVLPGSEEQRSLLIVELDRIIIGCTHFSLTGEDRMSSVQILNDAFKNYSKPVIVAGDLNSTAGSDVIKSIRNNWIILSDPSVPTIPSDHPSECIDYILGMKSGRYGFITKQAVVEKEPVASDHLPVWALIEVNN